jgi:chromate transporter
VIYLELFLIFFKIGAFTFGGGYAMLPLIQQEVLSQGWMDLEQLVNFIAVSESTPGPLAVNLSTYIGAETGGLLGSFCATVGVVLPSFVIILLVAKFYQAFQTNTLVKGCMNGLRPTVVGMIGASLLSVGASAFPAAGGVMQWVLAAVLLAAILAAHWKKVHPILLIVGSAVVGIAAGYAGLLPGV